MPTRPILVGALAAALVLSGCGKSSSGHRAATVVPSKAAPTTTASTAPGGGTVSAAQLQKVLLSVTELPTGYRPVDPGPHKRVSSPGDSACAHRYDTFLLPDPQATRVAANFEQGGLGNRISQVLLAYRTPADAHRALTSATTLFQQCQAFHTTDPADHATATLKIVPMSFPKVGDETVAVALTVDTAQASGEGAIIGARSGRLVTLLSEAGLVSGDANELAQLLRHAVTKMQPLS